MPRSVPGINRSPGGAKIRGVVHVYYSPKFNRWIARSWPKGNGGDTNKRRWSREAFSNAVQTLKLCSADDQQFAEETAKATPYFKRDILMKMVMGTLIPEMKFANKTYVSARIANMNIQQGLDTISQTTGAMVVRIPDGWVALVPGDDGDILTFDALSGLPQWQPNTGGGGGGRRVISFPGASFSTNDTGAFATLANAFVPANNFTVDSIYAAFNNATIGNIYNAFIATIDGSGNITGTIATATAFTTTATGVQQHEFDFSSPVTLTAGTNYIFALVITNGTGTSACRAIDTSTASSGYSNLPQDVGKMVALGSTSKRFWYAQNSAAPTSGVPAGSSSSRNYAIGVRAQL